MCWPDTSSSRDTALSVVHTALAIETAQVRTVPVHGPTLARVGGVGLVPFWVSVRQQDVQQSGHFGGVHGVVLTDTPSYRSSRPSSRPPRCTTRTALAGPCTSCGTARSGTWPPAAGPPPNSRPRAATNTSPPSGTTSGSAKRPPPGSPRTTTRSPAAPTDPVATDQFRSSVIVQPRLRPILVSCWRRPAIRSRASGPAIPIVMRSSVAW